MNVTFGRASARPEHLESDGRGRRASASPRHEIGEQRGQALLALDRAAHARFGPRERLKESVGREPGGLVRDRAPLRRETRIADDTCPAARASPER
jgi:hypothetical protein